MRRRILIVDDVPDWRDMLEDILQKECEVKTVDSYEAAMEVVRNRQVDLVIVDLRLSPTDENDRQGLKLLQKLTDYRINAIVLTGYSEIDVQREAEEKYKVFDFIDKGLLAGKKQLLLDVVHEAFNLLERINKDKAKAIRDVKNGLSVPFSEDLSGWPLQRFRKDK